MKNSINYYQEARKRKYAIAAFNFESYIVLEGIIKGANKAGRTVVAQLTEATLNVFDIDELVWVFNNMKNRYGADVLLHLDHGQNLEIIKACVDAGFDSVMVDASKKSFEENVRITREVVEYAHAKNVYVEAEIGNVGDLKNDGIETKAEEAYVFSHQTQPDILAVSVGSVHGGKEKTKRLNFDVLRQINDKSEVPLVLHGSSGVFDEDLCLCPQYGITKINIETELRICVKNAIISFYFNNPQDLRIRNLNKKIRESVEDLVYKKCDMFSRHETKENSVK